MITTKTKSYTQEELIALRDMMWSNKDALWATHCDYDNEPHCPTCKYRRLCADLCSTSVHLDNIITKRYEGGEDNE